MNKAWKKFLDTPASLESTLLQSERMSYNFLDALANTKVFIFDLVKPGHYPHPQHDLDMIEF